MAAVLSDWRGSALRGVLHSYTGTATELPDLLEGGLHIGIGGIVTFKPRADLRAARADIPADRLLLETDAPWLAPVPRRGKRNEPAYVTHTARCVADVLDVDAVELAHTTTENARALFGLPGT